MPTYLPVPAITCCCPFCPSHTPHSMNFSLCWSAVWQQYKLPDLPSIVAPPGSRLNSRRNPLFDLPQGKTSPWQPGSETHEGTMAALWCHERLIQFRFVRRLPSGLRGLTQAVLVGRHPTNLNFSCTSSVQLERLLNTMWRTFNGQVFNDSSRYVAAGRSSHSDDRKRRGG